MPQSSSFDNQLYSCNEKDMYMYMLAFYVMNSACLLSPTEKKKNKKNPPLRLVQILTHR